MGVPCHIISVAPRAALLWIDRPSSVCTTIRGPLMETPAAEPTRSLQPCACCVPRTCALPSDERGVGTRDHTTPGRPEPPNAARHRAAPRHSQVQRGRRDPPRAVLRLEYPPSAGPSASLLGVGSAVPVRERRAAADGAVCPRYPPSAGLRDHSWGPRYWQETVSYRFINGAFGDDLGFGFTSTAKGAGGNLQVAEPLTHRPID